MGEGEKGNFWQREQHVEGLESDLVWLEFRLGGGVGFEKMEAGPGFEAFANSVRKSPNSSNVMGIYTKILKGNCMINFMY